MKLLRTMWNYERNISEYLQWHVCLESTVCQLQSYKSFICTGDDAVLWQAGFRLLPAWVVLIDSWPVCCLDSWTQRSLARWPFSSWNIWSKPISTRWHRSCGASQDAYARLPPAVARAIRQLVGYWMYRRSFLYRQGHHAPVKRFASDKIKTYITSLADNKFSSNHNKADTAIALLPNRIEITGV